MSHIYELNVRTDVRSEHLVELSVSEQYPKSEVPPTDELPDLRTLLVDDDRGLRVMGLQGSEHPRFNEVMRVRENNGDSTLLHPFDSLSTHYLMCVENYGWLHPQAIQATRECDSYREAIDLYACKAKETKRRFVWRDGFLGMIRLSSRA